MTHEPIPAWFRLALVLRAPIRWSNIMVGASIVCGAIACLVLAIKLA